VDPNDPTVMIDLLNIRELTKRVELRLNGGDVDKAVSYLVEIQAMAAKLAESLRPAS
jgi:hypothetical protein